MNTTRKYQQGFSLSVILARVIVAVLFLYFLVKLITSGTKLDPDEASDLAVNNRIQSVGLVKVSDGIEPGTRTGEQVFTKTCNQCHAVNASIANSPKLGNNADWAPRIAKGFDTLMEHAINGFNKMPARGGASNLTDDEIARAIAYMANQSGANFVAPEVATDATEEATSETASEETTETASE